MDPVIIAQDGVDKFKQEKFEIIIVDTRYSISDHVGLIYTSIVVEIKLGNLRSSL